MVNFIDFGEKSSRLSKNLEKYERIFSGRKYSGKLFGSLTGSIKGKNNIAVLSLNSTIREDSNHEKNNASKYTGALAKILSLETECTAVFLQKKINDKNRDLCLQQLNEKLSGSLFWIVLRNHESNTSKTNSIKIAVDGEPSKKQFFDRLIRYLFEFTFDNYKDFVETEEYIPDEMLRELYEMSQGDKNSERTGNDGANPVNEPPSGITVICIDFDIDDFCNRQSDYYLAIKRLVVALSNMDWNAEQMMVYRLWQAEGKDQIPQDKVEFSSFANNDSSALFRENSFLHLRSYYDIHETVRARPASIGSLTKLKDFLKEKGIEATADQFAVLTNRMIENLYGREWIEEAEETPGLFAAPVIVYENERESYVVGIPKANQVNDVTLSTLLYKEKLPLSDKYEYMIFNRFSDSRMFIDVEKSHYKDNGRVPEKRVMLPRYYRLMMGYLEKPLQTIREEEYLEMYKSLDSQQKKDFDRCYRKIPRQAYYQLIEPEKESADDNEYHETIERVSKHLESLEVYRRISLIRLPKQRDDINSVRNPMYFINKFKMTILQKSIGKAEYLLKTDWAEDTDDKHNVARMNNNMMSLIGVSENDKIRIRFGRREITLRVLIQDELTDYEIGIPAPGRRALDMNSINDIVIVYRDMEHTFKRNSQGQTIAILGTVLAAAQIMTATSFFTSTWWGILLGVVLCIAAVILMLYFALSEERIKVK